MPFGAASDPRSLSLRHARHAQAVARPTTASQELPRGADATLRWQLQSDSICIDRYVRPVAVSASSESTTPTVSLHLSIIASGTGDARYTRYVGARAFADEYHRPDGQRVLCGRSMRIGLAATSSGGWAIRTDISAVITASQATRCCWRPEANRVHSEAFEARDQPGRGLPHDPL